MEKFSEEAKEIYLEALRFVNRKEQEARSTGKITFENLYDIADAIVRNIENSEQLNSYAVYYFDPVDITRSHVINTAIFATVLGKGAGYSGDQLVQLCAAGLLHDIGISKCDPAIFAKMISNLQSQEIDKIKNHATYGFEIIIHSDEKQAELAQSVHQHHEKGDGSGYPLHLTEKNMMHNSRILSLIDTYESLIHPRSHRDALIPPQGIQELLKQEGKRFSKKLMRTLIETISIYPAGCFVQLNSNEIARVIKTNKNLPTRPVVKILYDKNRNSTKQEIVDMAENNLLAINKCIPSPGMRRVD